MARKRKIGIYYSYNPNWIGGTYYIENLLKALELKDSRKFCFYIISSLEDFKSLEKKINFPIKYYHNDSFFKKSLWLRCINKVLRLLSINFQFEKYLDVAFPVPDTTNDLIKIKKKIFWIPDFQEKYYPYFFSNEEILLREKAHRLIIKGNYSLVFSSVSAKKDFLKFYPESLNAVQVLHFAVVDKVPLCHFNFLEEKYSIPSRFFICSNQFWKHKNHVVVLKAIKLLKNKIPDIRVVFTGKPNDYRDPEHYNFLLNMVKDLEIEKNVLFLGFIDRGDQLGLMKHSLAVIQPSLFEGWSTVIEDAKNLKKLVVASDISVHREQLMGSGQYFEPSSEVSLSEEMIRIWLREETVSIDYAYSEKVISFADRFYSLLENK